MNKRYITEEKNGVIKIIQANIENTITSDQDSRQNI